MILDTIAKSRFSYSAGSSGTITVPHGKFVRTIAAIGGTGATLTITPGGPGQIATAGDAIPIPSGAGFDLTFLGELGEGTVLAFASTTSYYVQYFAQLT